MAGYGEDLLFDNPELAFAPQRVGINRPGYTRIPPPKPAVKLPSGYLKIPPPAVAFGPLAQDRLAAQQAPAMTGSGLQSVTPTQIPFEQAESNLIGQQAESARAAPGGARVNDWDRIAANNKALSALFGQYHGGMSRGEYMQSAQSPLGATVYRADPGTRDFTVNPVAAAMGGGDRMANQQKIVDAMLARGGTMTNSPSFANALGANQEYQQNAQNAVQRQLGQSQAGALTSRAATEAGQLEQQKALLPSQLAKSQAEADFIKAQAAGVPKDLELKAQDIASRTEQAKLHGASLRDVAQIEAASRDAARNDPNMINIGYGGAGLTPPIRSREQAGIPIAPDERLQSLGLPTEGLSQALQQIEQSRMPMTPEAEAALMQKYGPEIEQRLTPPAPWWSLFTPAHFMQPTQTFSTLQSLSPASQMVRRMMGRNRPGVQVQKSKPGVQGAAPTATVYRGG